MIIWLWLWLWLIMITIMIMIMIFRLYYEVAWTSPLYYTARFLKKKISRVTLIFLHSMYCIHGLPIYCIDIW